MLFSLVILLSDKMTSEVKKVLFFILLDLIVIKIINILITFIVFAYL